MKMRNRKLPYVDVYLEHSFYLHSFPLPLFVQEPDYDEFELVCDSIEDLRALIRRFKPDADDDEESNVPKPKVSMLSHHHC